MADARFDSSDPRRGGWAVTLERPCETHVATRLEEVERVLTAADDAARRGLWAAVAVAYEAAPAFEPALAGRIAAPAPGLPLAWAQVYEAAHTAAPDAPDPADGPSAARVVPGTSASEFLDAVRQAQRFIQAGDSYQVNLTFQLHGSGPVDYERLLQRQQAGYCARLDIGSHTLVSLSPELFFQRSGTTLTARPMKGTAPRGRWYAEDQAIASALLASPKTRAENVMIVDLLRNDIGRVARPGSVQVTDLLTLERYPTLWQMTSTIQGEIQPTATLLDLFRALFPCGSVTGAPKIRTMEIISELERQPRGFYTGAIGVVQPGGDCVFNVAIRTIVGDASNDTWSVGVGAGITADSVPEDEYDECLLKAAFLAPSTERSTPVPLSSLPFSLLETMRLDEGTIVRRHRHLARMAASAMYFGRPWDDARVTAAIDAAIAKHQQGIWRVRLTVAPDGSPSVTCHPQPAADGRVWTVSLADTPIDERDPFLFNKTTMRSTYDAARQAHPDVDEVILWNARGEVTEATIANVVVEIDGVRVTPPVTSGLLGGTLRGELLDAGEIRERVITVDELKRAERLWLVNSLRGWIDARLRLTET